MQTTNRYMLRLASVWKQMLFVCLVAVTLVAARMASATIADRYFAMVAHPRVNATSTILYHIQFGQSFDPESEIHFRFDPETSLPLFVSPLDTEVHLNNVLQTVSASDGVGTFGYGKTGGEVILTLPTNVTIQANDVLEVLIGKEQGFFMPSATGTYHLYFDMRSPQNTLLESQEAGFIIAEPVTLSANIITTNPDVQVVNIKPELRVGPEGSNNDVIYYLTAYDPTPIVGGNCEQSQSTANEPCYPLFQQTNLDDVPESGNAFGTVELTGLTDATYDIGIKTQQHLLRKLRSVPVTGGQVTQLNFTDPFNGATTGTQVLLAGDINGAGTDTNSLGDDVINSIDLSLFMNDLDGDDPTGNVVRANLNQDTVTNSVDLSIMLKNLDANGDR